MWAESDREPERRILRPPWRLAQNRRVESGEKELREVPGGGGRQSSGDLNGARPGGTGDRAWARHRAPAKYVTSIAQLIHCDSACCCLICEPQVGLFASLGLTTKVIIPKLPDANEILEKMLILK